MTQADVPLRRCCHSQVDHGNATFPKLFTLDDTLEVMPLEFLVLLERGPDRWWDIAWQDHATGLIDGPWHYVPDLHDAKPIAWCLLPPIATTCERSACG
jgi:hypothetical protein